MKDVTEELQGFHSLQFLAAPQGGDKVSQNHDTNNRENFITPLSQNTGRNDLMILVIDKSVLKLPNCAYRHAKIKKYLMFQASPSSF